MNSELAFLAQTANAKDGGIDLRLTFNENAYNYDKIRPNYPDGLFKAVFDYLPICNGSSLLEIGIGTGKATLPFIKTGAKITAVELGSSLAEYCRVKFSQENVTVINGDFMSCNLPDNSFDLVYCATAFHWLPKTAYGKIKRILKPGGALALFWNHPFVRRADDKSNTAAARVYDKYRPTEKPIAEFQPADCEKISQELLNNGFQDIKSELYRRTRTLSSTEYISLMNTYSDHISLPCNTKSALERDMKTALDAVGGKINIYDTVDLYLARKKVSNC